MKNKKIIRQKGFLEREREREREKAPQLTINGESLAEWKEHLRLAYGSNCMSLTTTLPTTLFTKIVEILPFFSTNRSATLSYLIHQGLIRTLQLREHTNAN